MTTIAQEKKALTILPMVGDILHIPGSTAESALWQFSVVILDAIDRKAKNFRVALFNDGGFQWGKYSVVLADDRTVLLETLTVMSADELLELSSMVHGHLNKAELEEVQKPWVVLQGHKKPIINQNRQVFRRSFLYLILQFPAIKTS